MNLQISKNNKALCSPASIIVLVFLIWLAVTPGSPAQAVRENDPELSRIDVVEHPGDTIPMNLSFVDEYGDTVTLEKYFHEGRPVILVLAYYTCPMLCNLVLNGLADAAGKLEWAPGEQYRMVTISIDPTETEVLAAAKKKNYLKSIGKEDLDEGAWHFLTGPGENSKALADALGFKYFYDEKKEQYAHPAVIFVLTESGVISRYFYGIEFNPRDLKLALLEASEGKIGDSLDRIILYCFHYDPESGGYVVFARNVMMLGGAVTLVILAVFLGIFWLRERFRHGPGDKSVKHEEAYNS